MDAQTKANNALAPFLALAKSANSPRAAVDLVTQAISAPNTYLFTDLLQTPQVQALREADGQHGSYYRLLEIFAWGTYEDYTSQRATLPSLTPSQTHKLRLLSLLAYASQSQSQSQSQPQPSSSDLEPLSYSTLQPRLGLHSTHDLESLVTDAIYAHLLTGTLDPSQSTVRITSVTPIRDLAPGNLTALISSLEAWRSRCDDVMGDLKRQMADIKRLGQARAREVVERKGDMQRADAVAAASLRNGEFGAGGGQGGGAGGMGAHEYLSMMGSTAVGTPGSGFGFQDADAMDVDDLGMR